MTEMMRTPFLSAWSQIHQRASLLRCDASACAYMGSHASLAWKQFLLIVRPGSLWHLTGLKS
jgi:hypothetical protein